MYSYSSFFYAIMCQQKSGKLVFCTPLFMVPYFLKCDVAHKIPLGVSVVSSDCGWLI